jgi:hypothetical protein
MALVRQNPEGCLGKFRKSTGLRAACYPGGGKESQFWG